MDGPILRKCLSSYIDTVAVCSSATSTPISLVYSKDTTSRLSSASAQALHQWSGFKRFELPIKWQPVVEKSTGPGSGLI